MFPTTARQLLPRRLQLPQIPVWQCRCYGAASSISRRAPLERESQQEKENQPQNQEQTEERAQDQEQAQGQTQADSSPHPQPSASPRLSLYGKLFGDKPTSTTARRRKPSPSPIPGDLGDNSGPSQPSRPRPAQDGQDVKSGREVAAELGAAAATAAAAKTTAASGYGQKQNDVSHVGDELRAWFETAAANIQTAPAASTPDSSKSSESSEPSEHFVLILNDLSRSLVQSDFYRLAPKGQHVAGWAGGIIKIVQTITANTREPRGQYILFFNSRADAAAYRDHIDAVLRNPDDADLSGFTLTPRGSQLRSRLVSVKDLAAVVRAAGSTQSASLESVPYNMRRHLRGSYTGLSLSQSVALHLTGSKITPEAMAKAIEDDGAARNLPWRLIEKDSLYPLHAGSAKIAWGEFAENAPDPSEEVRGYTRFAVTFADVAEAKRFARLWHKREMVDDRTERTMVVNATALW